MEDLAKLQRRWEEAFESMPKLYETPEGLMVNFTLSEDTDTILFKEPWEDFELEDDEEAEFSKSWSKAEWINADYWRGICTTWAYKLFYCRCQRSASLEMVM